MRSITPLNEYRLEPPKMLQGNGRTFYWVWFAWNGSSRTGRVPLCCGLAAHGWKLVYAQHKSIVKCGLWRIEILQKAPPRTPAPEGGKNFSEKGRE